VRCSSHASALAVASGRWWPESGRRGRWRPKALFAHGL